MLVRWDKRRFACDQVECPRRAFTEVTDQLGRRRLLTLRLRQQLERAVSRGPRSVADVAREYAVSWWSANQALIDRAADVLGPARAGVRLLEESGWRRSDPWMTSFVDLDPSSPGGLLGLAPGRSGAAVTGWLDRQADRRGRGEGAPFPHRNTSASRPAAVGTGGPAARNRASGVMPVSVWTRWW